MSDDTIALRIAGSALRDRIPADKSLEDRVLFAMRYVRQHESDLLFMCGRINDDIRIRAALAGVMLAGNDEDRQQIERSLMPMRALAAAMQGIPVDFGSLDTDDILPIVRLWNDSKSEK